MKHRLRTRDCLLLPAVTLLCLTWAAPSPALAADGAGLSEADLRAVWECYQGLSKGARLRKNLSDADALLARLNAPLEAGVLDDAQAALVAFAAAHAPAEAAAARERVAAVLNRVCEALLTVVPPVCAYDAPNDEGVDVTVAWRPYPDAASYRIDRREIKLDEAAEKVEWKTLAEAEAGDFTRNDKEKIRRNRRYAYRVFAVTSDAPEGVLLGESKEVRPRREWVHRGMAPFFIFVVVLCAAVIYFIERVRRGVQVKVRKIAGLEAVDEAVGRATEMGRPILFVPGIADISDIQTIAGLSVLSYVSQTAAEHDTRITMPVNSPLTLTAAQEIIQSSYSSAGRPEEYDEDSVYFTTGEQFAYVAAVTGVMVRDKPATCFYMGTFFAESLILAETGNMTGSIQIAGTAAPSQLPFFVAACDYTLIGEEFFAASAYLSGEPHQLGSLKGQDVGKVIVAIFVVIGTILATASALGGLRYTWVGDLLEFMKLDILRVSQ